jgi:nucleoside-diphosphate-sugar epimerase
MRALVTGGCGYIGSALVPRLQADDGVSQVTVLDNLSTGSPANLAGADLVRDDLAFREGDVRDYGAIEAAMRDIDAVIHLAAITGAESTHERAAETRAVNLQGTENVLKAARKFDIEHVVFASSCNNYGRAESREIDETVDPDPINPYAQAKYESEQLLAEYADDYGMETTALRMSTNYGYAPGIRFNLVVNAFVFRALTNRPLTVYGDGSNWRPFVHVEDAARSFLRATTRPDEWPQRVYNVGANAANYRIERVAEIVDEELDRELDISYLREKQPGPSYHVNFDRLEDIGFQLQWSLPAGITDLAGRLGSVTHAPDESHRSVSREETDV